MDYIVLIAWKEGKIKDLISVRKWMEESVVFNPIRKAYKIDPLPFYRHTNAFLGFTFVILLLFFLITVNLPGIYIFCLVYIIFTCSIFFVSLRHTLLSQFVERFFYIFWIWLWLLTPQCKIHDTMAVPILFSNRGTRPSH